MPRFIIVWLGGALFVVALAWCVLWYGVALARPVPLRLWPSLAVDALLFSVFALHHSVFAREDVKAAIARIVPAEMVRSVYVWIASLLLIAVCVLWRPVGGELYQQSGVAAIGHSLVQLAGVWLIVRSVRAIDPLELAGIRQAAARAGDGGLQMGGVYGLVRHPIYLGWTLVVFGAAHMTGDRFAFAIVSTAYLALAIPWEERSLVKSFGADYERYQRLVRWRMIPFIY
jgi:methanethiol S-methyltransferase